MSDLKIYHPELETFPEVNNGVTWENLLIQNTFYGHEYVGVLNIAPTNNSLSDTYQFEMIAGSLPEKVILVPSTISSTSATFAGKPSISLFTGRVYETSYPYNEPPTDRYYFVIKATGLITNGTKVFYIDYRKDWCDIRNEFISKVENQDFGKYRTPVSNQDYLQYRIDNGDYTCDGD